MSWTTVEPLSIPAASGHRGVLVWRWEGPTRAVSSAAVGGGISDIDWVLSIGVASDYSRTDLTEHAREVSDAAGLKGRGIAMFTAVDLHDLCRHRFEGVVVDATVGISHPTWAADPQTPDTQPAPGTPLTSAPSNPDTQPAPGTPLTSAPSNPDTQPTPDVLSAPDAPVVAGTINFVVQVPVAFDPGAAVNAVMTITEAKTQALRDCGVQGTGTATDAVTVVWPADATPEPFAGPRSRWGSRIARSVYQVVRQAAGQSR